MTPQDITQTLRSPGAAWTGDFMESFPLAIPRTHEDTSADRHGRKNRSAAHKLCPDNGVGKR